MPMIRLALDITAGPAGINLVAIAVYIIFFAIGATFLLDKRK